LLLDYYKGYRVFLGVGEAQGDFQNAQTLGPGLGAPV
jgi:hypothetical protein